MKAESVTCSSCAKTFVKSSFYIQHYQSSHGGLPPEFVDKELFMCEECPSIFIEKHTLNTHKYHAHNKKRKLDNDNTDNSDSLKKLKKENIVHEPIECKICSSTFRFPSAYIKHYQDSHGSLPPEYIDKETFVCDQCPMVFISSKVIYYWVLKTVRVQLDLVQVH